MLAGTVWAELRETLLRLRVENPEVLLSYPNPVGDPDRQPPYVIALEADALTVAEELHRRFGAAIELRLGALPFPLKPDESPLRPMLYDPIQLDHQIPGLRFKLATPLVVNSGSTVEHAVVIANDGVKDVTLHSGKQIRTRVVSLADGKHVGGLTGAHHLVGANFHIRSGHSLRVPLLVGTASYRSDLGYNLPPGQWGVTADLRFGDGRSPSVLMPVLPITIALATEN
jgi:hypothetical protein